MDFPTNGGGKTARILRAPYGQNHGAFRVLGQRKVVLRLRINIETPVSDASNDSNNRQPLRIRFPRIAKRDSLSERVCVRPIFFCKRVVNNHNAGSVDVVRFSEETPAHQRRLNNSEIIR